MQLSTNLIFPLLWVKKEYKQTMKQTNEKTAEGNAVLQAPQFLICFWQSLGQPLLSGLHWCLC